MVRPRGVRSRVLASSVARWLCVAGLMRAFTASREVVDRDESWDPSVLFMLWLYLDAVCFVCVCRVLIWFFCGWYGRFVWLVWFFFVLVFLGLYFGVFFFLVFFWVGVFVELVLIFFFRVC